MASSFCCVLGYMLIVAALLHGAAAQTTHEVGELVNGVRVWKIPTGNFSYATWANNQTFTVSDKLQFNFATYDHDVAVISKAAYESCNKTGYYEIYYEKVVITIETEGEHYCICTIDDDCEQNQKLAIVASGSPISSYSPALILLLLFAGAASLFF